MKLLSYTLVALLLDTTVAFATAPSWDCRLVKLQTQFGEVSAPSAEQIVNGSEWSCTGIDAEVSSVFEHQAKSVFMKIDETTVRDVDPRDPMVFQEYKLKNGNWVIEQEFGDVISRMYLQVAANGNLLFEQTFEGTTAKATAKLNKHYEVSWAFPKEKLAQFVFCTSKNKPEIKDSVREICGQ